LDIEPLAFEPGTLDLDSSPVISERRDSLAIIHLNRPDKLNALSREMLLALSDAFKTIANESDTRAVILTGSGERAFCAGTDIGELKEQDEEAAREVASRGQEVCDQIEGCVVPVIAAINGIAAGGGCELALACHMRIAASNAQFDLPETKLGLIPGYGGIQRLTREIGQGRALELMLTRRTLSGQEALKYGLVNRVTEPAALLPESELLAGEIARLAPLAIRACLQAVTQGLKLPLAEGLELEAELFASLFATEDMREGTSAFLEKRAPVFKGI